MPSQLAAIIDGIAAQLATIPDLKKVVVHRPQQIGSVYPMVFFNSLALDYPETTYGEMTIGYDPVAYVVLAPIDAKDEAVTVRLFDLVPKILEVLGHDLDAHGALDRSSGTSDGQVLLTAAEDGTLPIAGHLYHVIRLTFRVIETFTYEYTL
jgi:hypothetical protein